MKFSLLSLFAALACVFGCNQKDTPKPGAYAPSSSPKIIRVCNPGPLASLHPHIGIDLQCRIFQKALFEGLTRLDEAGKPLLAGAQSVDISPCQTLYTFSLRPTQWTNGKPVTAFHYEKSWKSAIAPGSPCLRSDLFYSIKNAKAAKLGDVSLDEVGIYAADENTLVVELEHPAPYFLDLIASSLFAPLFDDSPSPSIFNGPFYIAQHIPDTKIVLRKNFNYWDSHTVMLDTLEASFISDSTTALHLYEKGDVDWAGHPFTHLPLDALPRLEKSAAFHSAPLDGFYWLCLNTKAHPLSSSKIRKALSMAIDRSAIAYHVLLGETPTQSIASTGMGMITQVDSKEIKSLFGEGLEELGLTEETFPPLVFSHSDVPGQKKLSEAIQECWQNQLGIEVKLQQNEWNVFFANLGERQFQIGGCIWYAPFHDPIYYLEFFKEKDNRYNSTQWENKHYQQLLELADNEKDPTIRLEHLRQAENLLLDEMPIIPLYVYHAKFLKAPHIQNLNVNHTGQIDFKWVRFNAV